MKMIEFVEIVEFTIKLDEYFTHSVWVIHQLLNEKGFKLDEWMESNRNLKEDTITFRQTQKKQVPEYNEMLDLFLNKIYPLNKARPFSQTELDEIDKLSKHATNYSMGPDRLSEAIIEAMEEAKKTMGDYSGAMKSTSPYPFMNGTYVTSAPGPLYYTPLDAEETKKSAIDYKKIINRFTRKTNLSQNNHNHRWISIGRSPIICSICGTTKP